MVNMNSMQTISSNFSPAFSEILRFCAEIRDPSPYDLNALAAVYRCVKKGLNAREKIYSVEILSLMKLKSNADRSSGSDQDSC